jgi:hypothetical protein
MKTRTLGILTLLVALTTMLWVALVIMIEMQKGPAQTLAAEIAFIESHWGLFNLNYVNAGLITLFTVAMLAGYVHYCWDNDRLWALIAMVFLPLYGLADLVAYLSQVFVVPSLLAAYHQPSSAAFAEILLALTLHTWPGSVVGFINALAYAALGIPSLILGVLLFRKARRLRPGGMLLAVSGVLSIVALIGVGVGSALLSSLVMLSGFLFLIALVPLAIFFLKTDQ